MLKQIQGSSGENITFTFNGKPVRATATDSVASALLAAGEISVRKSPISGVARGPFCMMGACFECLVEVDGAFNSQACMLLVRQGMVVRSQPAGPDAPA